MTPLPQLRVASSRRHLETVSGEPFFYLADTAWELFHRLDRDEAAHYLAVRARQGFNAVQAVALAEMDGLRVPNRYGELPFIDLDPTRPNEEYFAHVDWIITEAARLGIYTALLPTWGDKFNMARWGKGPEVFTPENSDAFATFLARRYRDLPIIWVTGGDRTLDTPLHYAVVDAMGRALRRECPHQLITFHPPGGQGSAKFVHDFDWLDFNMNQSGHSGRDVPNWRMIAHDRTLTPVKPTIDGEPGYEDHGAMSPNWRGIAGYLDDYDTRKAAWRAVFAGAAGHTYGCHPVWQMCVPGDPDREPINRARRSWRDAIELPGAWQVQHVRRLWQTHRLCEASPSEQWLRTDATVTHEQLAFVHKAMFRRGRIGVAYLPVWLSVQIDWIVLGIDPARALVEWINPASGAVVQSVTGAALGSPASASLAPPIDDTAPDWVLVIRPA